MGVGYEGAGACRLYHTVSTLLRLMQVLCIAFTLRPHPSPICSALYKGMFGTGLVELRYRIATAASAPHLLLIRGLLDLIIEVIGQAHNAILRGSIDAEVSCSYSGRLRWTCSSRLYSFVKCLRCMLFVGRHYASRRWCFTPRRSGLESFKCSSYEAPYCSEVISLQRRSGEGVDPV